MDPNRNRHAVAYDALGMVAGTAMMGKPEHRKAIRSTAYGGSRRHRHRRPSLQPAGQP